MLGDMKHEHRHLTVEEAEVEAARIRAAADEMYKQHTAKPDLPDWHVRHAIYLQSVEYVKASRIVTAAVRRYNKARKAAFSSR